MEMMSLPRTGEPDDEESIIGHKHDAGTMVKVVSCIPSVRVRTDVGEDLSSMQDFYVNFLLNHQINF